MFRTDAFVLWPPQQGDSNGADPGMVRFALLHLQHQPRRKTVRMLAKSGATFAQVISWSPNSDNAVVLAAADLLLVESPGSTNEMEVIVRAIRAVTRAPLVVLIESTRPEHAVAALRAGADAAIPHSTTGEIVIARCHALLRRWRRCDPITLMVETS